MALATSVHPITSQRVAGTRLVLSFLTIALMWLVVLPWLSRRPAVNSHLRDLDHRGIDPSAMYYTDLPVMDRILDRLEKRVPPAKSQ